MEPRAGPLRVDRMLQLGSHLLLGITRIVQKDHISSSCANCHVKQVNLGTVALTAIAVKTFFASSKDIHAVSRCLLGNYFKLVGAADRSAYPDNSSTSIGTDEIVTIDVPFRYWQCLPGEFSKRIKTNPASARIGQYDPMLGARLLSVRKTISSSPSEKQSVVSLGSNSSTTLPMLLP
jgi:hypothetical protein